MASGGANPTKVVIDNLPAHIAELETDLKKAVAEVLKIQTEMAIAKTLLAVSPEPTPEKK